MRRLALFGIFIVTMALCIPAVLAQREPTREEKIDRLIGDYPDLARRVPELDWSKVSRAPVGVNVAEESSYHMKNEDGTVREEEAINLRELVIELHAELVTLKARVAVLEAAR